MSLDLIKVFAIYGECKVYGPYTSKKDGRKRCVLTFDHCKRKTTVSYPKLLLETSVGRKLVKDETVDHIDADHTNNAIENLQILTRVENASKAHTDGKCSAAPLVTYLNSIDGKAARSARMKAKNPFAVFTESDVVVIRTSFKNKTKTVPQLALEYNVGERTIYNCLTGSSYDYHPGAISKSEFKRLNKESKHALSK